MTANDIYTDACALMDEIESDGTINDKVDYAGKAPLLINILQKELARMDGTILTADITSLTDDIEISDDAAEAMAYGLAAKFALADAESDKYQEYYSTYQMMKRTIKRDEEDIKDEYNIMSGLS